MPAHSVVLAGSVLFRVAPLPVLLGLAALPTALQSVRILRENYLDRLKMIPANIAIIKVYLITGVALIRGLSHPRGDGLVKRTSKSHKPQGKEMTR